jgi:hypothetical protein
MTCTDTTKQIMINLVEQFVIRKEDFKPEFDYETRIKTEQGIHFCVELDVEQFGYENDGDTHHKEWRSRGIKYLHYIVTGYHSVYLSIKTFDPDKRSGYYDLSDPKDWKNTSNHDSCWREDGFRDLFNEFINLYKEVYSNTPNEHKPAPIACTYTTRLRSKWLSGPVFDFVELETKYSDDGYHKEVLSVKKIKKTIEV